VKVEKIPPIDPGPIRPAGYFGSCHTQEDIREQNLPAKTCVIRPPADLKSNASTHEAMGGYQLIARKIVEVLRLPIPRW